MTSKTSESELLEQVLPPTSDSQSESLLLSSVKTTFKKGSLIIQNVTGMTTET